MRDGAKAADDFEAVAVPARRAAVLTYKGPFAGLPRAWDHMYSSWLMASGEEPRDEVPYEIYLNDPSTTAPDDLITEVVVSLK